MFRDEEADIEAAMMLSLAENAPGYQNQILCSITVHTSMYALFVLVEFAIYIVCNYAML